MIAVNSNHRIKARLFHFRKKDLPSLNEYGMESMETPLENDFKAFQSIQIERYLKRKTVKRFCSQVEEDVITQIVNDSWENLQKNEKLGQMDTEHKIHTFYAITIVFPYFVAEEESLISYDFRNKRSVHGENECFCGSNSPYRQCCGGITTLKDLLKGSF